MAPGGSKKLSLPSSILRELDIPQPGGAGRFKRHQSRKDLRKEARVQKRHARSSQLRRPSQPVTAHPTSHSASQSKSSSNRRKPQEEETGFSDDELDEDDFDENDDDDEEGSDDDEIGDDDSDEEDVRQKKSKKPHASKAELEKLAQDDKEISKLEKKLGLKGKKKLPKSFDEDGLGGLLEGLDGMASDDDDELGPRSGSKRKAEADEWLAQKRRKAEAAARSAASAAVGADSEEEEDSMDGGEFDDEEGSDEDDGLLSGDEDEKDDEEDEDENDDGDDDDDDVENSEEDEDEDGNDGFEGFSETDGDEQEEHAPPQRENPYVAPTTNVAKYVPPSLRNKQAGSTDQVDAQIRRRIQGLINRLTNENMTGILKDITNLYQTNPRQVVTSAFVDLILALVCSPERRPDAFFTMIAGFVAAVHKTMGVAISAQFLQQLVEILGKRSAVASGDHSDAESKHLVCLLSELYNMQVIGCNLIFDYIRLFLENLSELNTEMVLRIIQLCGPSLRRDDPRALREIINLVQPKNTKEVSVRTRFMIDEMKKLQSNKAKAVARNKDLAEQRTQLRKRIGTLKGSHDVQPLRVGLKDIQNSDTQGKWWLVGASWSGNQSKQEKGTTNGVDEEDDDLADETIIQADDDLGIPDLWQLAREQGFNTEVRQRIFVALHAATDCDNADLLVQKLRLNKHQRKEMAEVIVRSGERQNVYNHYYAILAERFSRDKEMRFQLRRCLTIRYKKMGEDVDTGDGDDIDDMDETTDEGVRWLYNSAKLYAFLVVWRTLKLVDVFKYRNLAALQEKAHVFAEVLLLTIIQESEEDKLKETFGGLAVDMDVGRGVQYFLKRYVRGTELIADKKAKKLVKKRCDMVLDLLDTTLVEKTLE
ncbi:hypothetical protein GGS20DRAFT_434578 [Poronia punctata]|nr:hypothetical protein GGS20DRAFT_434578 [Poronia punctata]